MNERALGIAGLVVVVVALIRWPGLPRWLGNIGLGVGAALLGVAIGLVVAERTRHPPLVLPPAASPARYVETRLALRFPANDEYPASSSQTNVFDWYAVLNSIRYTPGADEKLNKQQTQMLKLLVDVSWGWLIYINFAEATRYAQIHVDFAGGQLPFYQITRHNARYAVIQVQGHIPAGEMSIFTSE
jgi:hypothetical protein